ncbi:MAG: DNA topoisomerase I [Eggerthellaceae bacterium]|nr:DNA topoisomerase I [Eggerthellaceae bacterium]
MKLVVTEKNDAAQKIASLLGSGKPKADKVYSTPIYRFTVDGEEWVTIGLRGHILELDFPYELVYKKRGGWRGVTADGEIIPANVPASLPKPPFTKRKPFTEDGVETNGKRWKMEALPYLVYAPIEKLPKEKDIIRSLKNLAKKADSICIATDFDREGELIGADALACIREANPTAPVSRARYSAFTKEEITHAFSNLVALDDDLAAAGESRRFIDLIWGAALTRYLTLVKNGDVRSAGRVQTPTLALIVAREKERLAFVPKDYWVIKGSFGEGDDAFEAPHATKKFETEAAAQAVMDAVEGAKTALVSSIEKKTRRIPAPVPFNTTSLMAAAASEGISPARTMRIAESLYMAGYISYPRVDNTVYPSSLNLGEVVRMLAGNPAYSTYCNKLLAAGKLKATRGKKEETDHPPIYPTAAATPDDLSAADYKLYNLIARRFLATVSKAAVVEGTTVKLEVPGESSGPREPFIAHGDVTVDPGFRAIYPYGVKKDDQLPALTEGSLVAFNGATCTKKQTEPKPRYSQGALIQEMEKLGLGTKSTRHSIIERLYDVSYIQNDPIEPSQLGMAVIDALDNYAPRITHPQMTAELEDDMSDIASGARTKDDVVMISRNLLAKELEALLPKKQEVAAALSEAIAADAYVGICPECGKSLQFRVNRRTGGKFIGCSGWPECDVKYPMPNGKVEVVDEPCPACGLPQLKVTAFRQKARTCCIDPNCSTNYEAPIDIGACPECAKAGREGRIIAQRNPRTLKRFARCDHYEMCGASYPLPRNGAITPTEEPCPHCGGLQVMVAGRRGPWALCLNDACPGKEKKASAKGSRTPKRTKKTSSAKSAKTTKASK